MIQDINNTDILCGGDNSLYYELMVFLAVQSVQADKSLQTIVYDWSQLIFMRCTFMAMCEC